ncbi:MAG: 3D domain-containing protein [Desulfocapsaceae bacterium]|nr:3D domain-containing protein [Desulfocapsaceae bacterium]
MVPPPLAVMLKQAPQVQNTLPSRIFFILLLGIILFFSGCAKRPVGKMGTENRIMEVTGYCGCSQCCSWERGRWLFLKLDFWNRYTNGGREYSGLTASGTTPTEPQAGFFSLDSLQRPWMIPTRLILFPWYFLPEKGTIAADTKYYPFGTRMYIPGYGWGIVEDKGGAIKGPDRIDLFFDSHEDAIQWGRKKVAVEIERY